MINNYLKNYYNKSNVHIIDHLSSAKNYKTNFDKKVSKYGNYLSSFYCELVNYGSKDKFKRELCKTLFYITQKILLEFPYQDYINCIIQKK